VLESAAVGRACIVSNVPGSRDAVADCVTGYLFEPRSSADLIDKVTKEGWCDFDVAIATVEAMKEVRKCARILGPRGLMPNPKTGTVTDDTATAVKEAKGGKVDFRMDKTGNMAVVAGKRSFDADKLVQNIKAIVAAVQAAKPATVKGVFIKSMSVSSTMGIGVPVQVVGDAE
jgi:large subunit ribosomal protein L1